MDAIATPYWWLIAALLVINFPFVLIVKRMVAKPGATHVYNLAPQQGQISKEIKNSIATTPVHAALLAVFISTGMLRTTDENILTVLSSFTIAFLWTEIWHYASHIAMHTKPLHFIHREHHKSRVTNPWSSVSFSFLEKFIFSLGIIGFMALLSQFIAVSVFGIGAYYILYFYTNTLGHSNYEFRAARYYERFAGKIFNCPSYHAMHHARYTKNYGLMTPWLDQLFGTAWEDISEVQTRAAEKKPLNTLREMAKI